MIWEKIGKVLFIIGFLVIEKQISTDISNNNSRILRYSKHLISTQFLTSVANILKENNSKIYFFIIYLSLSKKWPHDTFLKKNTRKSQSDLKNHKCEMSNIFKVS